MRIIITLDYELFFGKETGTVQMNMIEATEKLLNVLNQYEIKAVFFIDVGFIKKLEELKVKHVSLNNDYELISAHLKKLSSEGHDLQLHIHPHWEDSTFIDGKWQINSARYRLSDWPDSKIDEIVRSYKSLLQCYTGNSKVFAYRAGGFCIQPFSKIKSSLKSNNIWLDSSVFKSGYNQSNTHYYDFRNSPSDDAWKFEEDPLNVNSQGSFIEIPISSFKVSPLFYWKLAFTRLMKNKKHQKFGEGSSLPSKKKWLLKKLTTVSTECASVDGYKSKHLSSFFKMHSKRSDNNYFVVIGHPKTLTEYSLNQLDSFIRNNKSKNQFHTFTSLLENRIIKKPY